MNRAHGCLLALLLAGCSSMPSPEELDRRLDEQERILTGLEHGQALQDVLPPMLPYQQASFEVLEAGNAYQYFQGKFPVTNLLFGVYFRNGNLASLITDQDVTDLARCRLRLRRRDSNWLNRGFAPYEYWFLARDKLGTGFDGRVMHLPGKEAAMSAADVAEAATYLPLILIALPAYAAYKVGEGLQPDAIVEEQQDLAKIELGKTSADDLLRLMGSPDDRQLSGETTVWTYASLSLAFGVANDIVYWKELEPGGIPMNPDTALGGHDCGILALPDE